MPTLQQLPQARLVNPTDEVLLQQGQQTSSVTVATLLAGTQTQLTLAPNALLGRISALPGGPETVAIGGGLALQGGTLSALPVTISGDLTGGGGAGSINVALPSILAGGTFSKVTVNAKGQVVDGLSIVASDVEGALGFTPYSSANPSGYLAAGAVATFPVMSYGAFFDGVHDDQPGIMAAIAAANAAGGGVVVLPSGKGCLANTIVQPNNNIHIVGCGIPRVYDPVTGSYDSCTVLSWIGAPGGTMISIGPAQNTVSGRACSNADLRGVMFDCAARGGVAILIASTSYSKFELGYAQPLQCGVRFTTVWLQGQASANTNIEINDSQHNSISIFGMAGNFTTTTVATAVPQAGSATVVVAAAGGFVPGMQVKIGSGLYIVGAVSGNTLTLTTTVLATDGVVGHTVAFFPRGVWLHGLTPDMLPAGVSQFTFGTNSYPCCWWGNISANVFEQIVLTHYTPGDGFTFGCSDHNLVQKLMVYTTNGANGVIFDGSNVSGATSAQNRIEYLSAGSVVARGTSSYSYASVDTFINCIDTLNGASYPTVETGATVHVRTDTGYTYDAKLFNAVCYEAGWEPITGTYQLDPLTSLTVVNNASNHIRLATGTGGYAWSTIIDGSTGDLVIFSQNGRNIVLGRSLATAVNVSGPLNVAGTLTAPTPAPTDSSTSTATTAWVTAKNYVTATVAAASAPVQSVAGRVGAIALTVGDVSGAAPLASPALTGVPTGPTAPVSDVSTALATTAFVASQSFLPQVATVAALRGVAYASLPSGSVRFVDAYAAPGDNGGGIFVWNPTATSSDNAGSVLNPTGNAGAGRWLRQLQGSRVTPQMFGAKGDGSTDDSAAFNAALSVGPIYVPPAVYVVSNVTVPNGALIEGDVGLGYSGDIASGTPTSIQQLTPVRPILLAKTGTSSAILNVYGNMDAIIKGVFLDGGANTPTCDGVSSGSTRLTMERVTIVRCVNGLGSQSNTDLYTHVATIIDCEFANNTNGVANLIDSVMIGGAVSANTVGVNLGSGANANNFIGMRFEWNTQDGLQGYQASSNQVLGGLFDRNAWRGANLGTGCADWTFTGVQFARNGSNNTYPNNSHIALNGTTSVFFTGCITRTGKNDDGTGTLSPAYVVNYINSNALVTISSSDVSGFVTAAFNGTNPTAYVQRDNDGAGDTLVTAARPYISAGVLAQTLMTKAALNVTPAQSTTVAMGQSPLSSNYSVTGRELVVTATNFNSPYQSCSARFNLAFYRDTAVHAPAASAAYGEAGGTGIVTWGGSGKLQLSATAVASDGSSWTLNILNGGSADGSNWGVWAELH